MKTRTKTEGNLLARSCAYGLLLLALLAGCSSTEPERPPLAGRWRVEFTFDDVPAAWLSGTAYLDLAQPDRPMSLLTPHPGSAILHHRGRRIPAGGAARDTRRDGPTDDDPH